MTTPGHALAHAVPALTRRADAAVPVSADTPVPFARISFALFLAGFSTFSLLYCVQPLLPEFARDFG
jgi:YNFM family putative membrane transporter